MKVLLFVDGSDASHRATDRALRLAAEGARVSALHAFPPRLDRDAVSHFEIEPEDLDIRFGREVLDQVGTRFAAAGLEVDLLMAEGHLVDVILGHAQKGFDLIILGAPPRPAGRVSPLGELLARKATVPLEVL